MLSKRQLAMGTFALAFTCAIASANAQDTKTILNVATTPGYAPLVFKDPNTSKLIGFEFDLFEAVAAKMGAKVNWIEVPWQQIMSSLKTKRADVIVSGLPDLPVQREIVSFVDYLNDDTYFVALTANADRFREMDTLCGKTVAVARDPVALAATEEWNKEHCIKVGKPTLNILETTSTADSRVQLIQDRADVAFQNGTQIVYQNRIEENRYRIVSNSLRFYMRGFAFPKKDPKLGETMKRALAGVIADGTYHELLHKWNLPGYMAITQPMINGQP
ncbi:polar amino acid transport system substrate-binding protein [Bradyrhizobium sp. USDA 4509]